MLGPGPFDFQKTVEKGVSRRFDKTAGRFEDFPERQKCGLWQIREIVFFFCFFFLENPIKIRIVFRCFGYH